MRRSTVILAAIAAVIVIAVLLGWTLLSPKSHETGTRQLNEPGATKAVPARAASPADDGNWTMPSKDYASTRFSGLNQINPANVAKLQVAFTFSTGTTEGFEAPPLVVGDTMYVVAPWPNNVFALDLTKPGAPPKWIYEPKPAAA